MMATEKRLKGYDPITLESFTRHITKHREPYDQYDMGYVDAVDQIENFLEYNTEDAVKVVHGRWVHPQGYVVSNGFICSECGHEEASHYPINPRPGGGCLADENGNFFQPPKINYCPNCGADMRGDGDA